MKHRDVVKILEDDGWFWKRGTGSHRVYKHATKPGIVVVAYHGSKDIPIGTVKSILRQAGLDT
jgi:predicted RNA binding protein YcfA (HicA-like mRNA interferase family)